MGTRWHMGSVTIAIHLWANTTVAVKHFTTPTACFSTWCVKVLLWKGFYPPSSQHEKLVVAPRLHDHL
jgi:hypothetical protein